MRSMLPGVVGRAACWWVLIAAACASDPAASGDDTSAGAGGAGAGSPALAGAGGASAGAAGASPAGTAGAAGMGAVPGGDFSFCGDRAPSSACSVEETCQQTHCGEIGSTMDARGCLAVDCGQDEDCAPGERCLAAHLQTGACLHPYEESCWANYGPNGECMCVEGLICAGRVTCMPESVAPRASDCDLTGLDCVGLDHRTGNLEADLNAPGQGGVPLGPAVTAAIQACLDAIAAEQTALGCTG